MSYGFFMMSASGSGGSGTPWTPANLSVAPKVWIDWNSSVTDVSGAASEWSNSQGSLGGVFRQGTAGARPTINASAVGGKRALEFDGSNDRLIASGGSIASIFQNIDSAWAFVIAAQRSVGGATRQVFEASTNAGVTRFSSSANPGNGAWRFSARRVNTVGSQSLDTTAIAADTNYHLFYCHVDYANASALVSLDGNTPDTASPFLTAGSTPNNASLRVSVGGNAADNEFGYMSIAAVISGSGSLPTMGERQRLEGWAAWELGLQANLPVGHPYKSARPYV